MEFPLRAGVVRCRFIQGARVCLGDCVSNWTELPPDEVIEPVASPRCCGQPEPELRGDLLDAVGVCARREVVALVDNDLAVAAGQSLDVGASGESGQHRDAPAR